MDEKEKAQLRASLIGTIESWFTSESEQGDIDLPWVGENTLAYVADCALSAIVAIKDAQDFVESEISD